MNLNQKAGRTNLPLTDEELRSEPIPVTSDDQLTLMGRLLNILLNPPWKEKSTGRLRVVIDPTGGAQTLGTVTTVGTVGTITTVTTVATLTNMAQIGGVAANTVVADLRRISWAETIRQRITG